MKEVLPTLYSEVRSALEQQGLSAMSEQLPELRIIARCGCGDTDCATFYVEGNRKLNAIEQSIIGVRVADTLSLEVRGLLEIDIDNFGRIAVFEVWGRSDVNDSLRAAEIPPRRSTN
jgi:uncharacterized protein YuzE